MATKEVVFDLDDPAFSSDHFRMYEFKVKRCPRAKPHDWTQCPFAHPGEKAKRRDARRYRYSGTACPEFRKNGCCKRGDSCPFAHGVFECWLHPTRYRTQLCTDGTNCKRRVCFFAHTDGDLRKVEEDPVILQQQQQEGRILQQQQQQIAQALASLVGTQGPTDQQEQISKLLASYDPSVLANTSNPMHANGQLPVQSAQFPQSQVADWRAQQAQQHLWQQMLQSRAAINPSVQKPELAQLLQKSNYSQQALSALFDAANTDAALKQAQPIASTPQPAAFAQANGDTAALVQQLSQQLAQRGSVSSPSTIVNHAQLAQQAALLKQMSCQPIDAQRIAAMNPPITGSITPSTIPTLASTPPSNSVPTPVPSKPPQSNSQAALNSLLQGQIQPGNKAMSLDPRTINTLFCQSQAPPSGTTSPQQLNMLLQQAQSTMSVPEAAHENLADLGIAQHASLDNMYQPQKWVAPNGAYVNPTVTSGGFTGVNPVTSNVEVAQSRGLTAVYGGPGAGVGPAAVQSPNGIGMLNSILGQKGEGGDKLMSLNYQDAAHQHALLSKITSFDKILSELPKSIQELKMDNAQQAVRN